MVVHRGWCTDMGEGSVSRSLAQPRGLAQQKASCVILISSTHLMEMLSSPETTGLREGHIFASRQVEG